MLGGISLSLHPTRHIYINIKYHNSTNIQKCAELTRHFPYGYTGITRHFTPVLHNHPSLPLKSLKPPQWSLGLLSHVLIVVFHWAHLVKHDSLLQKDNELHKETHIQLCNMFCKTMNYQRETLHVRHFSAYAFAITSSRHATVFRILKCVCNSEETNRNMEPPSRARI